METTKPDGSLDSIVDNLIFEPPTNPEPEAEEAVEATEDTQTEAVEDAEVVEDVSDVSDTDEEITDTEDLLEEDEAVPLDLTDDLMIGCLNYPFFESRINLVSIKLEKERMSY